MSTSITKPLGGPEVVVGGYVEFSPVGRALIAPASQLEAMT